MPGNRAPLARIPPAHAGPGVSAGAVTVALHITEPTIVGALREHFDDLWGRIAEGHRDKGYVIGCLERQIAALEGLA